MPALRLAALLACVGLWAAPAMAETAPKNVDEAKARLRSVSVETLIRIARDDKNERVRLSAIQLLVRTPIFREDVLKTLEAAATLDTNPTVRRTARLGIERYRVASRINGVQQDAETTTKASEALDSIRPSGDKLATQKVAKPRRGLLDALGETIKSPTAPRQAPAKIASVTSSPPARRLSVSEATEVDLVEAPRAPVAHQARQWPPAIPRGAATPARAIVPPGTSVPPVSIHETETIVTETSYPAPITEAPAKAAIATESPLQPAEFTGAPAPAAAAPVPTEAVVLEVEAPRTEPIPLAAEEEDAWVSTEAEVVTNSEPTDGSEEDIATIAPAPSATPAAPTALVMPKIVDTGVPESARRSASSRLPAPTSHSGEGQQVATADDERSSAKETRFDPATSSPDSAVGTRVELRPVTPRREPAIRGPIHDAHPTTDRRHQEPSRGLRRWFGRRDASDEQAIEARRPIEVARRETPAAVLPPPSRIVAAPSAPMAPSVANAAPVPIPQVEESIERSPAAVPDLPLAASVPPPPGRSPSAAPFDPAATHGGVENATPRDASDPQGISNEEQFRVVSAEAPRTTQTPSTRSLPYQTPPQPPSTLASTSDGRSTPSEAPAAMDPGEEIASGPTGNDSAAAAANDPALRGPTTSIEPAPHPSPVAPNGPSGEVSTSPTPSSTQDDRPEMRPLEDEGLGANAPSGELSTDLPKPAAAEEALEHSVAGAPEDAFDPARHTPTVELPDSPELTGSELAKEEPPPPRALLEPSVLPPYDINEVRKRWLDPPEESRTGAEGLAKTEAAPYFELPPPPAPEVEDEPDAPAAAPAKEEPEVATNTELLPGETWPDEETSPAEAIDDQAMVAEAETADAPAEAAPTGEWDDEVVAATGDEASEGEGFQLASASTPQVEELEPAAPASEASDAETDAETWKEDPADVAAEDVPAAESAATPAHSEEEASIAASEEAVAEGPPSPASAVPPPPAPAAVPPPPGPLTDSPAAPAPTSSSSVPSTKENVEPAKSPAVAEVPAAPATAKAGGFLGRSAIQTNPSSDTRSMMSLTEIPRDPAARKELAKRMLAEARRLLSEGKLDQAEAIAFRTRELAVRYGLFEDSPESLEKDLTKARQRARAGQAPSTAGGGIFRKRL